MEACGDAAIRWQDLERNIDSMTKAEAGVVYGKRLTKCVMMRQLCKASNEETVLVSVSDFELVVNDYKL